MTPGEARSGERRDSKPRNDAEHKNGVQSRTRRDASIRRGNPRRSQCLGERAPSSAIRGWRRRPSLVAARDDFRNPLELSQKPLMRLLGSRDKRHYVFDRGHVPPRQQEVVRETLDWLDRHLGPI